MLIGQYTHSIDDKKRLSLPAKFRKEIGKDIVMTNGLDSCLFIYSQKEWATLSAKLTDLPIGKTGRDFNRFLLAGAVETAVDSVGRLLIPDFLKNFAKLGTTVVLAGVGNRVEVWDEKLWKQYKISIEKQADMLAEKLDDIGAL